MPAGRVLVALDDPMLEPEPTWTRIDDTDSLVAAIDIRRGRQSEFDQTETSTATVFLNDTDGLFDPSNTGSPFFGVIDGCGIMLQVWNPFADEWVTQYRGFVDELTFDFNPATDQNGDLLVSNVALECVGIFEYFAGVEMVPYPAFGDTPPPESSGGIYYQATDFQTRLTQLATDAFNGDSAKTDFWCVFFTGNIDVQQVTLSPGDSVLPAIRDVVDAEMPTLANAYEDKQGRICAHGRGAVFDPDAVSATAGDPIWNFRRWKAGDGNAILLDADRAQIRPPLSWSRARSRIYNNALAYPRNVDQDAIAALVSQDFPSIDQYGYRSWSAPDLIIREGTTTGKTAEEECGLYGEFMTANYAVPRTRVEALTFMSLDPDDPRAEATWALICGIDVADVVNLAHGYPGAEGLDEDLDVQGLEMQIRPLNPEFDFITLTVNVTPVSFHTDDVGLMGGT